jgi:hypothetical protein
MRELLCEAWSLSFDVRVDRLIAARVQVSGLSFNLAHRQSVVRAGNRVRENGLEFADNFLNGCSGVR